jgi:cytochrome P450
MQETVKTVKDIPGTEGFPFLGEAIEQFSQDQLFYFRRFSRYGSIFRTRILWMKMVCLIGPNANQFVLKDGAEKFSSRVGWSFLEPLFGQGILLQDGKPHLKIKKLIYPAFHGAALAPCVSAIETTVEKYFAQCCQKQTPCTLDTFRQLSLSIIYHILLGGQVESDVQQLTRWFSQLSDGIETLLRFDIPLTKYGRALRARRHLELYLQSVIQQRHQRASHAPQDILSLFLAARDESGQSLADSEIVLQVLQLLLGGHETTAKLLIWLLFELAGHPQWVKQLREEQSLVSQNDGFSFAALKQLEKLERVIMEVGRLYPPIYMIPRGVVQEVVYGGYRIPPGWLVLLSPLLTHRLPQYYAEPNRFDPNRFAPPREEHKKHPFALISFGGGAHKCLGDEFAPLELKIILSILLKYYDWKVTPSYEESAPVYQAEKAVKAVKIQFKKRSAFY